LSLAADPVYRASPAPYFGSLALQHALGWLLIGGARARLHLAVRQEPQMPDAPAREWAWAGSAFPAARSWHFDNSNPVEWLVRRQRAVPVAVWTGALLTAVYPLLFTVLFRFWTPGVGGSGRVFIQFPSFAVSLISGALFAWAASRFVVQNRQDGGLELLLTTPVGANTIILEQWTALKRIFRLPVLVMLSIPLLQFVSLMVLNSRFGATIALIPTSLFLGMAHTVLYVGALCWTALWFGFKLQRPVAVVAWTVLVVEAVPYLFSTFWFFIFVPFLRAGSALPSAFGFLLWPMTQVVVLVFFVWLIRTRKARLLALFPPAAPRSFNLQRSLAEAAAKVRQARHWTPS
jgi:hypothetical protein